MAKKDSADILLQSSNRKNVGDCFPDSNVQKYRGCSSELNLKQCIE